MQTKLSVIAICALSMPAFAGCDGTMTARVALYAPQSGPRPSIPVALSAGTAWYEDANLTVIVPFNASARTFGRPLPNPTAIPGDAPFRLRGARLAPRSLAASMDGSLWGVGTGATRWGKFEYASTSAIVKYDPRGSVRAYPIPADYTAGFETFAGPNKRPWSMIWERGTTAAIVQINADGSITPKFTVPRDRLPQHYSAARYVEYKGNGIVWILSSSFPRPSITRWLLGSQDATTISLPQQSSGVQLLATAPNGCAWIFAEERNNEHETGMVFYQVSPAGTVTRYAIARMLFSPFLTPAAVFAAHGSIWGVAVVGYGRNVGAAYLIRIGPSGTLTQSAISGHPGSIAQENVSIAGPGDTAFLTSFSGALPELTYAP